jgi:asparagine synthase (glutamine-hydrolysing)
MRLICGVVRLDNDPVSAATLAAMVAAMTPAGLAPRLQQRVEGSAALAVLDFTQPASADGTDGLKPGPDGTSLAADLRLDRPSELAALLGLPGSTEAEALALAAFRRWDEDLPDRLDGDAALAFWTPATRRLVLTRDIMGVRPLCWAHQPGQWFAFASLPKGLHGSGVVAPQPDPVALGGLLADHYHSGPATGFQDIFWLDAGHSLIVSPEGLRHHRAWRPDPAHVGTWRGSPEVAAETLRRLIVQAVECRLPPAGPVAAHLSGGLDSSAVAVIAARALRPLGRRLHTWSHLPRRPEGMTVNDDGVYVDAVLAQEPDIAWTAAHWGRFDASDVAEPDFPVSGPQVTLDDGICAAAADAGAAMLLSGAGGDEAATYNGVALHLALFRQGRWAHLWAELPQWARVEGWSLRKTVLHRLFLPLAPEWLITLQRRLRGKAPIGKPGFGLHLLAPALVPAVQAARPPVRPWRNRPQDRVEMLTESYLVGRATRWAILGARHGIAFSFPLADRRILDYVLSLPLERFAEGGYVRQPFRNAMKGILPETIRLRRDKFSAFPDQPLNLAAAKPNLLAEIAALRQTPAATILDLDVVAGIASAIPEGAESERIAQENGRGVPPPLAINRAMNALRALALGRYINSMLPNRPDHESTL